MISGIPPRYEIGDEDLKIMDIKCIQGNSFASLKRFLCLSICRVFGKNFGRAFFGRAYLGTHYFSNGNKIRLDPALVLIYQANNLLISIVCIYVLHLFFC